MMGSRVGAATGVVLLVIGLVGFLWPRRDTRRPMAAVLTVNGIALCLAGMLQTGSGDGQAAALLVLGMLPAVYLLAGSLWRREER